MENLISDWDSTSFQRGWKSSSRLLPARASTGRALGGPICLTAQQKPLLDKATSHDLNLSHSPVLSGCFMSLTVLKSIENSGRGGGRRHAEQDYNYPASIWSCGLWCQEWTSCRRRPSCSQTQLSSSNGVKESSLAPLGLQLGPLPGSPALSAGAKYLQTYRSLSRS